MHYRQMYALFLCALLVTITALFKNIFGCDIFAAAAFIIIGCAPNEGGKLMNDKLIEETAKAMDEPYVVAQCSDSGCEHCGANKLYDVVFLPEDTALSTSYGNKEEADDLADELNAAYAKGRAASVGDQGLRKAAEDANEALRNILNGNDLALERGQSIENWKDSHFRKQGNDAYHALREVLTRQDGPSQSVNYVSAPHDDPKMKCRVCGTEQWPLCAVCGATLAESVRREGTYSWAEIEGVLWRVHAPEPWHRAFLTAALETIHNALKPTPESTQEPPSQQEAGFMQQVGPLSCLRCPWKSDADLTWQEKENVLRRHLDEAHPGWQSEAIAGTASVQPPISDDVVKWMIEDDPDYCAYLCFSNGGIHIADSDTDKAFKVWRGRDVKRIATAALAVALAVALAEPSSQEKYQMGVDFAEDASKRGIGRSGWDSYYHALGKMFANRRACLTQDGKGQGRVTVVTRTDDKRWTLVFLDGRPVAQFVSYDDAKEYAAGLRAELDAQGDNKK